MAEEKQLADQTSPASCIVETADSSRGKTAATAKTAGSGKIQTIETAINSCDQQLS